MGYFAHKKKSVRAWQVSDTWHTKQYKTAEDSLVKQEEAGFPQKATLRAQQWLFSASGNFLL